MKNLFNSIKLFKPKKNVFDLTHDVKLSLNMGELVPIMCMDCVPGDKVHLNAESIVKFAPLVSPVMHRFDVMMHYFFVPNRLVWPNWEKFITYKNNPVTPPAFPYFLMGEGSVYSRLADYLGLPTPDPAGTTEKVSALPFAAYQLIYNEYYRDQNLIPSIVTTLIDGDNTAQYNGVLGELRQRAWEHDYFTSCLPTAQQGGAVDIPLGEVTLNPDWFADASSAGEMPTFKDDLLNTGDGNIYEDTVLGTTSIGIQGHAAANAYDPAGSLEVEPTTINDLRRAFRLQEWLEKNIRAGSRYIESIFAHFGVKSPDARLQRPEYITGTKSPVTISEVLNTTGTDELPQGNMAGHGISVTSGRAGSYYCQEHGYVIGIMSIMPKTAYQQGIPRHFLKTNDAFEYFWPEFAHIGEQEVKQRELYAYQNTGDETFGYLPRYAEYKYMPSRVSGDFRNTLDFWHDGRIFSAAPTLNKEFIECFPDPRIFAVEDEDVQKIYAYVLNKVKAIRPMPKFGTPMF